MELSEAQERLKASSLQIERACDNTEKELQILQEATTGMAIQIPQYRTCGSAQFLQCTATVIPSLTLY